MGAKKRRRLAWLWILLPLAAIVICWMAGVFSLAERQLQDRLYQHPNGPSPKIFVIGIDEVTEQELGPFENWSRMYTATLINLLMEDPDNAPAVIGLDIGFYGEKNDIYDMMLADACARAGNVVAASAATFGQSLTFESDGSFRMVNKPQLMERPFAAMNAVVETGHTNINLDTDGVVRKALQRYQYEGETVESFAGAVYRRYTGKTAEVPLDSNGEWRIAYSALPYEYFGPAAMGASFSKVLDGRYPAAAFRGAIVLIGAYAQGMKDSFYTPVSRDAQMYGVEVHANVLQGLLEGKWLHALSDGWTVALCAGLWGVCLLALVMLRFRFSLPIVLAFGIGYVALGAEVSKSGLMLPIIMPVAGMVGMSVFSFGIEFTSIWQERRRIVADFSRYLPKEVAKQIADNGEEALQLGGVRRDLAVLFVDIRGFTPLSERMDPGELVAVLNQFLHLTTTCIFGQNGTVDKFIGDATMALFNAPASMEDYVYHAVCAGLDMVSRSLELTARLLEQGYAGIGFGVGVNCGEAIVGNVGTEHRMEYTAIGDTVNTAARLESQALAGEVLISQAVYEQVASRIECTYLGERKMKGKQEPVPVWCAIARKTPEEGVESNEEKAVNRIAGTVPV